MEIYRDLDIKETLNSLCIFYFRIPRSETENDRCYFIYRSTSYKYIAIIVKAN